MGKLPLTTGAYAARSLVAEAQRCVNLYGEKNPQDSPFPFTYYPSRGLTLIGSVIPTFGTGWRQLYYASNNQLYGVCGSTIYAIKNNGANWTTISLGNIISNTGFVSMVDNGQYMTIVDGSGSGWQITLSNNVFATITDPAFAGGNTSAFIDGYLIYCQPTNNQWYISLVNQVAFNALDFAQKTGAQDRIVGIVAAKRYVYLFGAETTEVWFDAGDTPFAFDRLPGIFIQWGCMSAASIATMDGDVYWLAQSPQGMAVIVRSRQFSALQISTFAINDAMQSYTDLNQAIGFVYQFDGHLFYVLSFPVSDVTWQYDLSTEQWNQLGWIDANGIIHRHRANCFAQAGNQAIVGDWQNGNLYLWDENNYTDNGNPIVYIRSFPHGVDDASNRIKYQEFIANMEVGNGNGSNSAVPVSLRWSDTRGKSWSNPVQRSLGLEGDYLRSISWRRLGQARDRVFEISWSAPVKTALLGAWVDAESSNQ